MMKIFILVCLLFPFIGCVQEKDCKNFKTGTFRYIDNAKPGWIIIRNDSIQIEKNENTQLEFEGKLKWKSDCEFTITYKRISDSSHPELIGKQINVRIINTSDNIMEYEATMNGNTVISKMQKIN